MVYFGIGIEIFKPHTTQTHLPSEFFMGSSRLLLPVLVVHKIFKRSICFMETRDEVKVAKRMCS